MTSKRKLRGQSYRLPKKIALNGQSNLFRPGERVIVRTKRRAKAYRVVEVTATVIRHLSFKPFPQTYLEDALNELPSVKDGEYFIHDHGIKDPESVRRTESLDALYDTPIKRKKVRR